ncbi:arabinogalactan oligomer / maltooligosaccharide transport system substrate-binding protein [Amphibacillus marinus]|uniref:Maltodextrin-binding protein n=1 Tax=Amphibacillus marinus TaxID=872970 RepID=A0A1H8MVS8_9BACI|nr:extracellular solute-binding protein [Amphibacillus marinus]SEO21356.1 arabinogalactan oligomer / maltooligosaccharide transport system substrate-binding protein [Amphibacillus marinus]
MKFYKLIGLSAMAFVMVACGNGSETETGNNTENTENGSNGEVSGSIEVGVGEDYVEFVEAIIPAFEDEYGVEVTVSERDMFDTLEAVPLDGPAGLSPDVLLSPYDRIGGMGQQGHLSELTLPDDGRYDETDEQQVTVNDQVYGVPFVIESLVLFYNKDLIEAPPMTFEELEELADEEQYAFTGQSGTSTAFLANWVDFYNSYGLISGFGGYVFGGDGEDTADIGLNTAEAIEGIEYAQKWFNDIWPEGMLDVTSAGDFIDDQFIQGNAVAVINGPWGAANYRDSGVNLGVAPIPTLPNGNPYEPFAGGKGWVIPSYSENFEAAAAFVAFVTNEENMMLLYEDYTNEIPANQQAKSTISDAADDELAIAVIDQYNNAVPMPNIPEMAEVWTGAESMMFDAGYGNKTAEESANDAVQTISENIEQKY